MNVALSEQAKAEELGQEQESALIYNYIGYIYYQQKQYAKADSAYLKAISINEAYKNKKRLFLNYNNLSASFGMRNRYNEAIEYAYLAIHQLENEKDKETIMICLRNVAGIYYMNKEYSLAMKNLREVKEYQLKQKQTYNLIDTYRIMFMVFRKENRQDSALFYLKHALELAQKLKRTSDEILLLQSYASLNRENGDYEIAYNQLERVMTLQDSVGNERNKKQIENMAQLYTDERQQHLEDTAMEEEFLESVAGRRNGLIAIALLLLAAVFFLLFKIQSVRRRYLQRLGEELKESGYALQETRDRVSELSKKEIEYNRQTILKEKELTTLSLNTMRNEEFIAALRDELRQLLQEFTPKNTGQRERLYKIISLLNQQESGGLSEEFPALTSRDLRLCAFLRMGLSTKEIADITFRETRSIESARNRLRKKCNISQQED